MRVIGIDPGTVSIDVCGLDDGRVFLDSTFPTADALADPGRFTALLESAGALDFVAGPSGYGLPLIAAADLTEQDLRLAYLAPEGEAGGIGGLRALMRMLARSRLPVFLMPGVVHLPTVPDFRKVNRVDMGTADKVCSAALAIDDFMRRHSCQPREVSLILVELGGAFTAALAVEHGRIVDGVGGTSGPLGYQSAGAWDGEVAYLASRVSKDLLFRGGVTSIPDAAVAWDAYIEGVLKSIAALTVSAPRADEVILSGRHAMAVEKRLARRLDGRPLSVVTGFAAVAKQGAQGAALIADGLAGGRSSPLVDTLGIRDARGTALDHLHVISAPAARARLGIE